MSTLDIDHLRQWVGTTRESRDTISPRLAHGLAAVLDSTDAPQPGDVAPSGIQWCLSPDIARMSGLGPDGHPARGGFLPPVPLPRRMWAGGRLQFHGAFRVGDEIRRLSRVASVEVKEGRSGALCFVAVLHEYHGPSGLVLNEQHDIVYRDITPSMAAPAPGTIAPAEWREEIEASPVLLARYSAVTFNGHRIHYDRDYCRDEELYPGLVVHGPLQATYLLAMAARVLGRMPGNFRFRGVAPLFDGQRMSVNGTRAPDGLSLWTAAQNGAITMQASAT